MKKLPGILFAFFLGISMAQAQPGSLDLSFTTNAADSLVYAVAVQPDGKILLGGAFNNVASGNPRNRIARLLPSGLIDTSFGTPAGANDVVYAIALQSDGKVVIGGQFTTVNGTGRSCIARLTTAGAIDPTFNPGTGAEPLFSVINAVAILPDGRIVAGGSFSGFNGSSRDNIVVLNSNGSVDDSFVPDFINGAIQALAAQPDGRIVIGGYFSTVNFNSHANIARLSFNGKEDPTFGTNSGPNSGVLALALQSDGKVVIGGEFNQVDGTSRGHVARLNSNGNLDTTFTSGTDASDTVLSLTLDGSGKTLLGGFFQTFNGAFRGGIVRLNANGNADTTFNAGTGTDGTVRAIATQNDAKVVIGGGFSSVNGVTRNFAARLNGESVFEFSSPGYFALENSGSATVTVRRLGGTNSTVSVNFATSNLTAFAGSDYTSTNGTLTFSAGQTNKTFTVPIANDVLPEFNESLLVQLSNPTAGALLGAISSATVAIIETNSAAIFEFETNSYRILESVGQLLVKVYRTGGGSSTSSVNYATIAGNALAGSDYVATNGTLTFTPTDVSQFISISILDNWPVEGDEAFSSRLSSPSAGALLGSNTNATVTIIDQALSYEDLYGHNLRIESVEDLFIDRFMGSFSNRLTIRNTSSGTSLPGTVRLTSLDPAFNRVYNLPAIPGRATATLIVGGLAPFASDCPFDHAPPGSCTNKFFATVFEPTTNGVTAQDSRMIFVVVNTQPPTGGVPVGGGGLPAPGFNPPPFMTNLLISGASQIDEGAFSDYTAAALLSNGTTNTAVIPAWSSSAFQISSAGRLTTSEVIANTAVAVRATVTMNDVTKTGTNTVTVLDIPAPQINNVKGTNNAISFTILGSAGRRYAVDKAIALTNPPPWVPLSTNVANLGGTLQFSEPRMLPPGARFYRARRVP